MKASRQRRLAALSAASQASGKPPRTHGAFRSARPPGRQNFARLKGSEFQLRHAAGQAFARLAQQQAGGRAEQQELAGGLAGTTALIDHARRTANSSAGAALRRESPGDCAGRSGRLPGHPAGAGRKAVRDRGKAHRRVVRLPRGRGWSYPPDGGRAERQPGIGPAGSTGRLARNGDSSVQIIILMRYCTVCGKQISRHGDKDDDSHLARSVDRRAARPHRSARAAVPGRSGRITCRLAAPLSAGINIAGVRLTAAC